MDNAAGCIVLAMLLCMRDSSSSLSEGTGDRSDSYPAREVAADEKILDADVVTSEPEVLASVASDSVGGGVWNTCCSAV